MPLTGGENGAAEDVAHQNYLDAMESYTYNAMGCMSTDPVIKGLYAAYNRRMRDDVGKKCQVVVSNNLADYEGVVSVKNGRGRGCRGNRRPDPLDGWGCGRNRREQVRNQYGL